MSLNPYPELSGQRDNDSPLMDIGGMIDEAAEDIVRLLTEKAELIEAMTQRLKAESDNEAISDIEQGNQQAREMRGAAASLQAELSGAHLDPKSNKKNSRGAAGMMGGIKNLLIQGDLECKSLVEAIAEAESHDIKTKPASKKGKTEIKVTTCSKTGATKVEFTAAKKRNFFGQVQDDAEEALEEVGGKIARGWKRVTALAGGAVAGLGAGIGAGLSGLGAGIGAGLSGIAGSAMEMGGDIVDNLANLSGNIAEDAQDIARNVSLTVTTNVVKAAHAGKALVSKATAHLPFVGHASPVHAAVKPVHHAAPNPMATALKQARAVISNIHLPAITVPDLSHISLPSLPNLQGVAAHLVPGR